MASVLSPNKTQINRCRGSILSPSSARPFHPFGFHLILPRCVSCVLLRVAVPLLRLCLDLIPLLDLFLHTLQTLVNPAEAERGCILCKGGIPPACRCLHSERTSSAVASGSSAAACVEGRQLPIRKRRTAASCSAPTADPRVLEEEDDDDDRAGPFPKVYRACTNVPEEQRRKPISSWGSALSRVEAEQEQEEAVRSKVFFFFFRCGVEVFLSLSR